MVYMFNGDRQEAVYTFLNSTMAPGQNFSWASNNVTALRVGLPRPIIITAYISPVHIAFDDAFCTSLVLNQRSVRIRFNDGAET
jgi:hypothetical protein